MLSSKICKKTALWQVIAALPILGCSTLAHSLAYQTFLGLNYSNPAEMTLIKNLQFIVGGDEVLQEVTYKGTFGPVTGTAKSDPRDFLPNGRLAMRMNDKLVIGVDVTQPGYTHFDYPVNSFIRAAAITTYIRTTDVSPRVAYQATDKLSLGLGFNATYSYESVLSNFVAPFGEFSNQGNPRWSYGMNAGLFYALRKGTYLSFAYFSKIALRATSGNSTWGPNTSVSFNSSALILPETFNASLTQYVSPKWLFNGTIRYNVWEPQQALYLYNTALAGRTVTLTQKYINAFRYALATKYDFNDKWAGLAGAEYSPTSQNLRDRGLGLPVAYGTIVGVGVQAVLSPGLTARLLAGHVFADPEIDIFYGAARADGHVKIGTNTVGFRITYES